MNTVLYKNIISHTLFLKGWCWLCVRGELETGTDCYFDPKFFFNHSSTSFSSWLGVAQPWITEGHKPSVCKLILTLASYLLLTWTVCTLVILLFNAHLLLLFFRLFTQVHLLIDHSVEGQYITYAVSMTWWWAFYFLMMSLLKSRTVRFVSKEAILLMGV